MKKQPFILGLLILLSFSVFSQDNLAPFLGVPSSKTLDELKVEIGGQIKEAGFVSIGDYQVAGNDNLWVICFTRDDLKKAAASFKDRGALASVLKMALRKNEQNVEISLLHPNYMFHAYFRDDYKNQADALNKIDADAKNILRKFGEAKGFGGELSIEDLAEYHYKVMMPYFDDPEELQEYGSFEEGLDFIRKKINGVSTQKVYELVDESNQTAVFGIALTDPEKGEAAFLPIIGERHIAAMPYDIILQGKTVSMLHGKYRFALYWPELSMGTFMKIMSTPGDVEDAMETVTEK